MMCFPTSLMTFHSILTFGTDSRNLLCLNLNTLTMRLQKKYFALIAICTVVCSLSYSQETGSFTDSRDGHDYKTIKLGDQMWMGENLAFKTDDGCWVYEGVDGFAETYGYLYSWEVAKDVCPDGWRLPTDSEFVILWGFLGGSETDGGKLKETGTDHWNSPNAGATNSSGFTAISSGKSGDNEHKMYLGLMAYFWTSEDYDDDMGASWALYSAKAEFTRYGLPKEDGVSVRCLKE